ncbi:MAG: hypothetical protein QM741_07395 [Rudaea sp.]|uniref:hypothetical protein n=1 Tax=Rudaea sp. TaxID=2136325 RepID=UPI0039E52C2D
MRNRNFIALALVAAASTGLYATRARAADKIDCELRFNLSGWAAIYKHAEGNGTITCNNGRSFNVHITAVGGGLTAGKYKVENGKGKFAEVSSADQLFGSYAQGEANAGLVKSGTAQVLTKGTSTLALSGAGEGVDLGISFGKFTITRTK